ncbi:MAG: hypothetical protein AAF939_03465 [Planctomycetota bacterium]
MKLGDDGYCHPPHEETMVEYDLKIGKNRSMKFKGQLISSAEKEVTLASEFVRTIRVSVYGIEEGGFVASAEFESTHPRERAFGEIEEFDCVEDVDKFFYVFDLHENVSNASGLTKSQKEECELRANRLTHEYEALVFPILKNLTQVAADRGLKNRIVKPKKSGFWNPFQSSST